MTLSRASAGPELLKIIHSTRKTDDLLRELQKFLESLPCPYVDVAGLVGFADSAASPEQRVIIQLFKLELLLFFTPDPINFAQIEEILKEHAYLSLTNTLNPGSSTLLTRLKFNDLAMDYQFLFSQKVLEQKQGVKFVDLVTKKINLLSLVPDSDQDQDHVTNHIRRKVLVYYLLCDSDYRKRSVLKYLYDENVIDGDLPGEIFALVSRKDKLIDMTFFINSIGHVTSLFYPLKSIRKFHESQLIENHLDNNLSKLPRYYASITLSRMAELLLGEDSTFDLEELIFKMITCNKFPHGAKIDQISGVVSFSEKPSKYTAFDEHVKRVCDTVDEISTSLASGSG